MKRKQIHKFLGCLLSLALLIQVLPSMGFQITLPVAAEGASSEPEHLKEVPEGYTGIYTKEDLDAVRNDLAGKYILMNDIVFVKTDFNSGGPYYNAGKGWEPIGTDTDSGFTGIFDGNAYVIKGIVINRKGNTAVGLFGSNNGTIQNLGLTDSIMRASYIGGIAGLNNGTIQNCFQTGEVSGSSWVGGIAGYNNDGIISGCYNTGNVVGDTRGSGNIGGITGWNSGGTVSECHNFGNISGPSYVGGISGLNNNMGTIINCYNTGDIEVSSVWGGGIAGMNTSQGEITACYNRGNIHGTSTIGGVTGENQASIKNCYNIGSIQGSGITFKNSGVIANCYNIGRTNAHGITENNSSGTLTDCYYLSLTHNGISETIDGAVEYTMDEMQKEESFRGFDFGSVWEIGNRDDYLFPVLRSVVHVEPPNNTVEFSGGNGTTYNPYRIVSTEHLNNIREYLNADFILNNDIVFSEEDFVEGGAYYNEAQGWEPIGEDNNKAFTGFFNGNNHIIQGLSINRKGNYIGLFGYSKGTIKNLGIEQSTIIGACKGESSISSTGGITGYNEGNIVNCYNSATVKDMSPRSRAGGVTGYNKGNIIKCYHAGNVCGSSRTGGITGWNDNLGIIANCNNMGSVCGSPVSGGIAGENSGTITDCEYIDLTIKQLPIVRLYSVGAPLVTDGLYVEANYNGDIQKDVTADCSFAYDFGKKGHQTVTVSYENLCVSFTVMVIGESAEINLIDPAFGNKDIGYYFKEGASLNDSYYWGDTYLFLIEDTDDAGQSYSAEISLSVEQITGYDSTPGEKVLVANIPVGSKLLKFPFPALVIPADDFDRYMSWKNAFHIYNHTEGHYTLGTAATKGTTIYNFNGTVTAQNVNVLLQYIAEMEETNWPYKYGQEIPITEMKGLMEKYFVITEFDLSGAPNYNAQNNTFRYTYVGGSRACILSWFFRIYWDKDECGNLIIQYRVKNTSSTHYHHNADWVVSPEGKIISITMMPEQVELVSPPNKTAYIQGDKLDLTGGQIKATYDSQRSETIPITTDMVSGYNPNTIGAQTVTVTYGGKSVTFPVTVTAKTVTSITWKSKPAKTTYIIGQPLDLSGAVITATYTGGSVEDIQVTADMVSGYAPNKTGSQTITVTYAGKTVTFTVTVEAKTLTGIVITKKPDKLTYLEGEAFDKTGIVVTASYNNGTTETVTDYQVSGYNSTPGTKTITVSYQGKTASFTVTVAPKSLRSIAITKKPTKLTYIEGEQLNLSGLVVTASYDNGTSGTVTGYQVSGYTSTPGTKTITITYGGKSATFTVTVQAKAVSSISMKANPSKTTYLTGESLNLAGAKITVKYNNNTQEDIAVTTAMVSGYNANQVGSQTVTVTYAGKSTSFKVTVQSRIPSSITSGTYSISGGFISKIGAGTTVSQLLNGINEKAYCKVYKGSSEVTGGTLIGTGMTINLLDGSTVKQTLTIVVTGDTNGDGNITITDMLAVKSHLLKKSTLSGAAAKAADTSGDKAISITDFIQIKAHILGKDKVQARAC